MFSDTESQSQPSSRSTSPTPTSAYPGVSSTATDNRVSKSTFRRFYKARVPGKFAKQAPKGSTYIGTENDEGDELHWYKKDGQTQSVFEGKDDHDYGPEVELPEF
ncbi:hypothetical protein I302_106536 [Kwoniella bestiolae CBS 10118]|uniref:Uncharacterized protein n=1 Tax=Kwoniella bestiolae CBS 10118 TaxID=1296100 RepID=A0A1B9G139_9TREE|nr:hypothetical protein I302_06205 [Kwoniella bestiolae CBS 10118]OCF24744.1 hypothetical protein I302_06205 [Kwoniella bestiolae CBS 10118]